MNIRIEQLNPSDKNAADKFVESYVALFNHKENLKYLSFTNKQFTKSLVQNRLAHANESGIEYYVAIKDTDTIIGILMICSNPTESFEITSLVVDSQSRGLGIGKQFIATAIQKAREKGFIAIDVAVFADNKTMLSLMIKYDFKPVKIEYHKRFDGEDLVHLKKYLI